MNPKLNLFSKENGHFLGLAAITISIVNITLRGDSDAYIAGNVFMILLGIGLISWHFWKGRVDPKSK